ncbi:hypothetical protein [Aquamicrobium terrae]
MALFLFFVIPGTLAAQPSWQRIEDFRSDLTAEAQADATAIRARALATEAYLWGLPAFLNFRQATEFKAARRHLAPDAEPFGGWMLLRDLATPDVDNALPNVDTLYPGNPVRRRRDRGVSAASRRTGMAVAASVMDDDGGSPVGRSGLNAASSE